MTATQKLNKLKYFKTLAFLLCVSIHTNFKLNMIIESIYTCTYALGSPTRGMRPPHGLRSANRCISSTPGIASQSASARVNRSISLRWPNQKSKHGFCHIVYNAIWMTLYVLSHPAYKYHWFRDTCLIWGRYKWELFYSFEAYLR